MSKIIEVIISSILFTFIIGWIVSSVFMGSVFMFGLMMFILSAIFTLFVVGSIMFLFTAFIIQVVQRSSIEDSKQINKKLEREIEKRKDTKTQEEKIEELKQEYADGNLTNDEFDQKLEEIMKKKDEDIQFSLN